MELTCQLFVDNIASPYLRLKEVGQLVNLYPCYWQPSLNTHITIAVTYFRYDLFFRSYQLLSPSTRQRILVGKSSYSDEQTGDFQTRDR